MNKEEFVKRAIEIHGNKYDYSKTIYKNIKTNIKYIVQFMEKLYKTQAII